MAPDSIDNLISNTDIIAASSTKAFTDTLLLESLGTKWRLIYPFRFYYLTKGVKLEVTIPKDFITDFASTPTWAYPFFPPVGIYNKATIMHDYLYDRNCHYKLSRRQADLFFLQAMKVLKVPFIQRICMYLAVRIGGRRRFRKKSSLNINNTNS